MLNLSLLAVLFGPGFLIWPTRRNNFAFLKRVPFATCVYAKINFSQYGSCDVIRPMKLCKFEIIYKCCNYNRLRTMSVSKLSGFLYLILFLVPPLSQALLVSSVSQPQGVILGLTTPGSQFSTHTDEDEELQEDHSQECPEHRPEHVSAYHVIIRLL